MTSGIKSYCHICGPSVNLKSWYVSYMKCIFSKDKGFWRVQSYLKIWCLYFLISFSIFSSSHCFLTFTVLCTWAVSRRVVDQLHHLPVSQPQDYVLVFSPLLSWSMRIISVSQSKANLQFTSSWLSIWCPYVTLIELVKFLERQKIPGQPLKNDIIKDFTLLCLIGRLYGIMSAILG